VKEETIKARKNICKVTPADIGLQGQDPMAEAKIFEHHLVARGGGVNTWCAEVTGRSEKIPAATWP
jgi:hypothetical protein